MNKDDIIRMAREAGFCHDINNGIYLCAPMHIERFATLVAAAEREACVDIIESYRIPVGNSASGELACEWTYDALHKIRDDIRARGQE